MKAVLKKFIVPLIIICLIALVVIVKYAPDTWRKIFGSETEKAFYQIEDLLYSYDFNYSEEWALPGSGGAFVCTRTLTKHDDYYNFHFDLSVYCTLEEVAANITEIIDRINNEVLTKIEAGNDTIKFNLHFHTENGLIEVIPQELTSDNKYVEKDISVAFSTFSDFNKTISSLKDCRRISIGEYRGFNFIIPEDFDYDIFTEFSHLEQFEAYIEDEESAQKLKSALESLNLEKIIINHEIIE